MVQEIMRVIYQCYCFTIRFSQVVILKKNPTFILRSILGMNLRSLCCIAHTAKCADCLYNTGCVYAQLFESIIPKSNTCIPGRERASHPYSIVVEKEKLKDAVLEMQFSIILLGKYIEYFPYIYGAFVRAGNRGFGKERVPFSIQNITVAGQSILENSQQLILPQKNELWQSSDLDTERTGDVSVRLLSPLRFKTGGSYSIKITAASFMQCLFRRLKTLVMLYGDFENAAPYYPGCVLTIAQSHLFWDEFAYYSSRQQTSMELGGVCGSFVLRGTFSALDCDLLEFARLFGAGKNTNFGLGRIDYVSDWKEKGE